jgi:hypothetical protein
MQSTSNFQMLWCGLPDAKRAARAAARLLKPDLFTGWGLRILSSENPAYNPLSYQRGLVWPHDTLLAAAGLWRYGHYEEASTLIRSTLEQPGHSKGYDCQICSAAFPAHMTCQYRMRKRTSHRPGRLPHRYWRFSSSLGSFLMSPEALLCVALAPGVAATSGGAGHRHWAGKPWTSL